MTSRLEQRKRSGGRAGQRALSALALAFAGMMLAAPAEAYVGPSLGLGLVGAVIGVLAAVILTIFGLVWYPVKRMIGKKPAVAGDAPELADTDADSTARDRAD